jgi:hypothetical protein
MPISQAENSAQVYSCLKTSIFASNRRMQQLRQLWQPRQQRPSQPSLSTLRGGFNENTEKSKYRLPFKELFSAIC